jgi:uncharacterized protein (DUF2236 family)
VNSLPGVAQLRTKFAAAIFERVAGEDTDGQRARAIRATGPRWFDEDRPIRQVHGDAAMFLGGLRAVLLQSLHPLAMAGVAAHSGYRGDPWGRLQRTSYFLGVTTFGTATDAAAMIAKINGIHRHIKGIAPDGRPYAASDPHLLKWVHVSEVDSFLLAHQRYGKQPLDQAGRDGYVLDTAKVARGLGVIDPPTSEAELHDQLAAFRPELRGTDAARDAARFLLFSPPLPLAARFPYAAIGTAAVSMLPAWARWPLRLPYLPVTEATIVRIYGEGIVRGIRWATTPGSHIA